MVDISVTRVSEMWRFCCNFVLKMTRTETEWFYEKIYVLLATMLTATTFAQNVMDVHSHLITSDYLSA